MPRPGISGPQAKHRRSNASWTDCPLDRVGGADFGWGVRGAMFSKKRNTLVSSRRSTARPVVPLRCAPVARPSTNASCWWS